MNVSDVMTRDVATCGPGDSLNRAAQLMWERRCGTLPVIDAGGGVVGMLTDRDVCMAAYTQGRRLDDITVGTAMSRPAQACAPSATIEEAEDLMMAHAVRRLAVLDERGRLAGVLSIDDVARAAAAWNSEGDIDAERVALVLGEISRHTTTTEEDGPEVPETDVVDEVRDNLQALKTLRDEIRVDINLAGKELRDRWRRLETRLRAAELRAKSARRTRAGSLARLVETARQFQRGLGKKRAPRPRAARPTARASTRRAQRR
jgi:CBS-domain-containing membrane protein